MLTVADSFKVRDNTGSHFDNSTSFSATLSGSTSTFPDSDLSRELTSQVLPTPLNSSPISHKSFLEPSQPSCEHYPKKAEQTPELAAGQLLKNASTEFMASLVRILTAPGGSDALVLYCQEHTGYNSQFSFSAASTSLPHSTPSQPIASEFSLAEPGRGAAFDADVSASVDASSAYLQVPASESFETHSNMIGIPSVCKKEDVGFPNDGPARHHTDKTHYDETSQSRNLTEAPDPESDAPEQARSVSNGPTPEFVLLPIYCSSKTKRGDPCRLVPSKVKARELSAGEKWFCRFHKKSVPKWSQQKSKGARLIFCDYIKPQGQSCKIKASKARSRELEEAGVKVWICHHHRKAAGRST